MTKTRAKKPAPSGAGFWVMRAGILGVFGARRTQLYGDGGTGVQALGVCHAASKWTTLPLFSLFDLSTPMPPACEELLICYTRKGSASAATSSAS